MCINEGDGYPTEAEMALRPEGKRATVFAVAVLQAMCKKIKVKVRFCQPNSPV